MASPVDYPAMKKNRIQTEQKIIDAVKNLLLEEGFTSIGINAIARTAGCDKVLIYRYFGNLDGLLQTLAEQNDLWWNVDEIILENMDEISQMTLPRFLELMLKRHISEIQKRPLTQELLAWELSANNSLIRELSRKRTEQGMLLVKKIRLHYDQPNIDIGGILGIFGAAINYLLIRTRHKHSDHEKEEWWRLEHTINNLLAHLIE